MGKQVQTREREAQVEKLLREQPGFTLSQDFRRNVMEAVSHLPAPGLVPASVASRAFVSKPSIASFSRIAWAAGLLALVGVTLFILPGGGLLDLVQLELESASLCLTWGSSAADVSLLSAATGGVAMAMLAGVGLAAKRMHLVGG